MPKQIYARKHKASKQARDREKERWTDVQINRFTSENHLAILINVKSKLEKIKKKNKKNQNNNKFKAVNNEASKEKINGPIYQCI